MAGRKLDIVYERWRELRPTSHWAGLFALASMAGVLFFIAMHVLAVPSTAEDAPWSLYTEGGYAERYQQVLAGFSMLLLLTVSAVREQVAYLLAAAVMGFLVLDDALQLHEQFGAYFADQFTRREILGLKLRHYGEALFLAGVGAVTFGALLFAILRAEGRARADTVVFLALILAAGVFGFLADFAHAFTGAGVAGVIEDGGELAAVALIAAFSVMLISENLNFSKRRAEG